MIDLKKGLPFGDYAGQMTEARKQGFMERYEKAAEIVESNIVEEWKQTIAKKGKVSLVAFSEGWCGDCMFNLPYVAYLAEQSESATLHCFSMEKNKEEFEEMFPIAEERRIPSIIAFDASGNEIGRWIERPTTVKDIVARGDKEDIRAMRVRYGQGEYANDVCREMIELVK